MVISQTLSNEDEQDTKIYDITDGHIDPSKSLVVVPFDTFPGEWFYKICN